MKSKHVLLFSHTYFKYRFRMCHKAHKRVLVSNWSLQFQIVSNAPFTVPVFKFLSVVPNCLKKTLEWILHRPCFQNYLYNSKLFQMPSESTIYCACFQNVQEATLDIKRLIPVIGREIYRPVACLHQAISWPIDGVILFQHPRDVCLPRLIFDTGTSHINGWADCWWIWVNKTFVWVSSTENGSRPIPWFTSMTRMPEAEIPCYCSISVWWDHSMHTFQCQAFLSPIWHENRKNNRGIWCDKFIVQRLRNKLYNLYKSCSLAPMFAFGWSSCGRKSECPEETHLPDLTWCPNDHLTCRRRY